MPSKNHQQMNNQKIPQQQGEKLNKDIIIGRNAVTEALKAGRSINRLLIAEGSRDGSIQKLIALAKDKQVVIESVSRDRLDKIADNQRHQGVIAYSAPVEYSTLEEILQLAENRNEFPFILLLDELEDPHNFGAILRTADAVGVHGVLIPKRRSVSLNSTVAKTSAGAIEYVKVAQINNVAQTLKQLKGLNITVIGSDMEGIDIYDDVSRVDFKAPIVLIIGSEGKGMRRLTKENCDFLIEIPMVGRINSLNASVAAAVLMYEIFRQRNVKSSKTS